MALKLSRCLLILPVAVLAVSCSVTRRIPAGYPVLSDEFLDCSGRLESVAYPTSVPGPAERRMYVYLPEDFADSAAAYPVLYVLHGARGDEASWITQGHVLPQIDSLRRCGVAEDVIVVFPNMNSYDSDADFAKSRHKGALESFFEVDGCVESSFVRDVVGAVDSLYPTVRGKEGRAIAGLSLGGMQAMYISASHPDVFGYVGIFSAPKHSFLKKGPYSGFYDGIDGKIDSQFIPEPPLLYAVYVGSRDIYRNTMKKFCKELTDKGYCCRFHLDEGGHQWSLWASFLCSFMNTSYLSAHTATPTSESAQP